MVAAAAAVAAVRGRKSLKGKVTVIVWLIYSFLFFLLFLWVLGAAFSLLLLSFSLFSIYTLLLLHNASSSSQGCHFSKSNIINNKPFILIKRVPDSILALIQPKKKIIFALFILFLRLFNIYFHILPEKLQPNIYLLCMSIRKGITNFIIKYYT